LSQTLDISIVVSVYNEAEGLAHFWDELKKQLSCDSNSYEVIFVNDGSLDGSVQKLEAIYESQKPSNVSVKLIEFSKNFGHESAMIAGIDHSSHGAIICMDADLQHPVEKVQELINAYKSGHDIVLTKRMSRADNGMMKNILSRTFYSLLNSISDLKFSNNSTDFFLISAQVAGILKENFRDRNRFIRGFIQQIGFNSTTINFDAPARAFGESSYSLKQLFSLAVGAVFAYSNKPLRISILLSIVFILFTLALAVYSLYEFFNGDTPPSGYTTIIIFLSASFSALFVVIAILSMYFEKALIEQRNRPLYIVKKVLD
jgi:dolichol-phosphate mannosyltransferase